MYKRTQTYKDYDGNERTEDFYFNLSETELARLELSEGGGLSTIIRRIIQERDNQKLWNLFEKIIQMSCGRKSDDGRRFDKSPEAKAYFLETNAYSDFIFDMINDTNLANEFVAGLVSGAKNIDKEKMREATAAMRKEFNLVPNSENNA